MSINTQTSKPSTVETVEITFQVPISMIRGLLCCAFEGGSNYWYKELDIVTEPTGWKALRDAGTYWHWCQFLPTIPGGQISFGEIYEDTTHTLDLSKCIKGWQVMAEKYPRHFANVLSQNDDSETGDVYLQCCVFGELVYG